MFKKILFSISLFLGLSVSSLAGDYYYKNPADGFYYPYVFYSPLPYHPRIVEKQPKKINKTKKHRPHKKYESYEEFKKSDAYLEMKAERWMRELTKKAEASLAKKKELENLQRYNELKNMSAKQKFNLKSQRRVEKIMGKDFSK